MIRATLDRLWWRPCMMHVNCSNFQNFLCWLCWSVSNPHDWSIKVCYNIFLCFDKRKCCMKTLIEWSSMNFPKWLTDIPKEFQFPMSWEILYPNCSNPVMFDNSCVLWYTITIIIFQCVPILHFTANQLLTWTCLICAALAATFPAIFKNR